MQKWEYKIAVLHPIAIMEENPTGRATSQLNDLGNEGWELVAVYPNAEFPPFGYFKRKRPG